MRKRKSKRPLERLREIAAEHGVAPSGLVIATNQPMELNQVLPLAGFRFVVSEVLTVEEFRKRRRENEERRARDQAALGISNAPGRFTLKVEPGRPASGDKTAEGPTPEMKYFYALRRL